MQSLSPRVLCYSLNFHLHYILLKLDLLYRRNIYYGATVRPLCSPLTRPYGVHTQKQINKVFSFKKTC